MIEAIRTFFISLWSKKFFALVGSAIVLVQNKQFTELVILISAYFGIEVADKKLVTQPKPIPSEEPIPPEATPAPAPAPDEVIEPDIVIVSPEDADAPPDVLVVPEDAVEPE